MSASIDETLAKARGANDFAGGITALGEGTLYALQNPFVLDGRVSSYAASARGFSVANSYLLTESDAALLTDTGFGSDEPVLRAQVESLIARGVALSMFPLRLNEYGSTSSCRSIMSRLLLRISTWSNARPATLMQRCGSISVPRPTVAAFWGRCA